MTEAAKKKARKKPAVPAPAKTTPVPETAPMTQEAKLEETKPASLSVSDIRLVRNIIEVSSTRGAFKANELKTVGEVFEKVDAFVKHYDKLLEESKETK